MFFLWRKDKTGLRGHHFGNPKMNGYIQLVKDYRLTILAMNVLKTLKVYWTSDRGRNGPIFRQKKILSSRERFDQFHVFNALWSLGNANTPMKFRYIPFSSVKKVTKDGIE